MLGEIKEQIANSTRFSQVIMGVSELMSGQLHTRLNVQTNKRQYNLGVSDITLHQDTCFYKLSVSLL